MFFILSVLVFQSYDSVQVLLKRFEQNEFLDKIQTWGLNDAANEHQRKAAIYIVATLLNKNRECMFYIVSAFFFYSLICLN